MYGKTCTQGARQIAGIERTPAGQSKRSYCKIEIQKNHKRLDIYLIYKNTWYKIQDTTGRGKAGDCEIEIQKNDKRLNIYRYKHLQRKNKIRVEDIFGIDRAPTGRGRQ